MIHKGLIIYNNCLYITYINIYIYIYLYTIDYHDHLYYTYIIYVLFGFSTSWANMNPGTDPLLPAPVLDPPQAISILR